MTLNHGTNKTLQRTWLDGWLLDLYRPIEGLAVPIITDAILEGDVNSVPASFPQPSVSHITCACERKDNDNLNLLSLKDVVIYSIIQKFGVNRIFFF